MDPYKDRIRPLFDSTGLSDQELALRIGVPVKQIYNWNQGVKSYRHYYGEISRFLSVSEEYLKGKTDEKIPAIESDDGGLQEWAKAWAEASPEARQAALAVLRLSAQPRGRSEEPKASE